MKMLSKAVQEIGKVVGSRRSCAGRSRLRSIVVVVMAATGCFTYRPAPLAPAPGAKVRIILCSPMAIITETGDGEGAPRSYDGVFEASGTVAAVAGDTLALRLGELRTSTGPIYGVGGEVALLPATSISSIQQRRFDAGRSLLGGMGLSFLAMTTLLLSLIVVLTRAAV